MPNMMIPHAVRTAYKDGSLVVVFTALNIKSIDRWNTGIRQLWILRRAEDKAYC